MVRRRQPQRIVVHRANEPQKRRFIGSEIFVARNPVRACCPNAGDTVLEFKWFFRYRRRRATSFRGPLARRLGLRRGVRGEGPSRARAGADGQRMDGGMSLGGGKGLGCR
jgi:hypothetical protein